MKDEKWYDVYDIRKELANKGISVPTYKEAYELFKKYGYEFDFDKYRWRKRD